MDSTRVTDNVPWDHEQHLAVWVLHHPGSFGLAHISRSVRVDTFNAVFDLRSPHKRSVKDLDNHNQITTTCKEQLLRDDIRTRNINALETAGHQALRRLPAILQVAEDASRGHKRTIAGLDNRTMEDLENASRSPQPHWKRRLISAVLIPARNDIHGDDVGGATELPMSPLATPHRMSRIFSSSSSSKTPQGMRYLAVRNDGSSFWHQIPQSAIVHTFAISDLTSLIDGSAMLRDIMQLPVLTDKGDYQKVVRGPPKKVNNALDTTSTSALAELMSFFGISYRPSLGQVAHMLGDMIRGLGIVIEHEDAGSWQACARAFDYWLDFAPSAEIQVRAQLAF